MAAKSINPTIGHANELFECGHWNVRKVKSSVTNHLLMMLEVDRQVESLDDDTNLEHLRWLEFAYSNNVSV